jgi:hypothetical protein
MTRFSLASVLLALLLLPAPTGAGPAGGGAEGSHLVELVRQIQRADYEGDRAALERLYGELAPVDGGGTLGTRVRYWRGFALWRKALNGFNDSVDPKELETDLGRASNEFEKANAVDPHFADAMIGRLSCLSNLLFLNQKDPARVQQLVAQAGPLRTEAESEAPENPRLFWVLGPNVWYAPPERGGSQQKAMDLYQRGLDLARRNTAASADPLEPSWGEPELLMNLAWANLHKNSPDLDAAERDARSALALVPYWRYVRDTLLPQILHAKKTQ